MERLKDEIKAKKEQINFLQKQIADSFTASDKLDESGVSLVCSCDAIVAFVSLCYFSNSMLVVLCCRISPS